MLADAIRAETFKLTRNWRTSFFAFLFVPVGALILGLAIKLGLEEAMRPNRGGPLPLPQFDFEILPSLVGAIQQASNPLIILFCLIGAAVLFAGEYRWETWRLMMPRNNRLNQLLGKIVVYALAAGLSLLLTALALLLVGLVDALSSAQSITLGGDGSTWASAGKMYLVGWVHLLQAGAVACLAAVFTRSIMAALMIPLGLGLAQGILQGLTSQGVSPEEMEWWRPLLMPAMASDILKAAATPPPLPGMGLPSDLVWAAAAALAVWIISGFVGGLLLFSRQDLSKE